jgi:hypothetical protein
MDLTNSSVEQPRKATNIQNDGQHIPVASPTVLQLSPRQEGLGNIAQGLSEQVNYPMDMETLFGTRTTCPICNVNIPQCQIRAVNVIRQEEGSRTLYAFDETGCDDVKKAYRMADETKEALTVGNTRGWSRLLDERCYCEVSLHFSQQHAEETLVNLNEYNYDGSRPHLPAGEFRGGHSHGKIPLIVHKCPFDNCFAGNATAPGVARLFTKETAFWSHFGQTHCRSMHFMCSSCFLLFPTNPKGKGPTGLLRTRCTARTHFNRDNPDRHGKLSEPNVGLQREMRRKRTVDFVEVASDDGEVPEIHVRNRRSTPPVKKPKRAIKPEVSDTESAAEIGDARMEHGMSSSPQAKSSDLIKSLHSRKPIASAAPFIAHPGRQDLPFDSYAPVSQASGPANYVLPSYPSLAPSVYQRYPMSIMPVGYPSQVTNVPRQVIANPSHFTPMVQHWLPPHQQMQSYIPPYPMPPQQMPHMHMSYQPMHLPHQPLYTVPATAGMVMYNQLPAIAQPPVRPPVQPVQVPTTSIPSLPIIKHDQT